MAITQEELGKRLRAARRACRMTQAQVAHHLGVSRSTIAQMELGNRSVTSLELDRLAYVFGRPLSEFLADEFREEDTVVALFRAHPDVAEQEEVVEAVRYCLALGRELTNLERILGIDREGTAASRSIPAPRNMGEAVDQGAQSAAMERRRLDIGSAPISGISDLLNAEGVRTGMIEMPDDVSGLTLCEPGVGLFVVVNSRHHLVRRRFSQAHEYAHVVLDRDRRGIVSRTTDRNDLSEVRANAFAAAFLMPEDGIRHLIAALGKGRTRRGAVELFDEADPLRVNFRAPPGSQDIQMYDVVQFAHYFGVSRLAALYRLRNLRFITAPQLDHLREQEDAGAGKALADVMALPEPDHAAARNQFRHRFLGLALEALRRRSITRAKFEELAAMIGVSPDAASQLLRDTGAEYSDAVDATVPER